MNGMSPRRGGRFALIVLIVLELAGLAPRQAKAAQPAEDFRIFFDFGSAELTDKAKELAKIVAQALPPSAWVTLIGHCEGAEPAPDTLSRARAEAVLAELRKAKLPAKVTLDAIGVGANEPRFKTEPTARDPQSRYVGIVVEIP